MEKLLDKITQDAESKIQVLKDETQAETARILAETKLLTKEKTETLLHKGKQQTELEHTRVLSLANSAARKQELEVLDHSLKEVHSLVMKDLASLRKHNAYQKILNDLIAEAIQALPNKDLIVKVNEHDKSHVSLPKTNASIEISTMKGIQAGAIIVSKDGNAVIDNSFESLFTQKWPQLKAVALKELLT